MAREITRVRPFIEENTKTVSLTFMERPSPTGLNGSFVFEPLSSASKESRLQPNTRPIKCFLSPQDGDHQGYRMTVIHAGERSCFCCIKHFVIVLHSWNSFTLTSVHHQVMFSMLTVCLSEVYCSRWTTICPKLHFLVSDRENRLLSFSGNILGCCRTNNKIKRIIKQQNDHGCL